jgi:D-serine deaminase-like pyridoxal phosphate-dependent protein
MTTPLAAKIARDYGTPCAVIDMDKVERNIARVQAACDAAGVANRPHIKTHKSPLLAKMQIAAGAKGITCQKLGEAEVMAAGGIDDILISYNLIGEEKMARLAGLQAKADMTVAADNATVIAGLPRAPEISGRPLSVVVECDTGRKRAGRRDARRGDCAGARDRGVGGTDIWRLHAVSDRERLGRSAGVF